MDEYFLNGLVREAVEVLKELVHPRGMGDVMKACMYASFDKVLPLLLLLLLLPTISAPSGHGRCDESMHVCLVR